MKNLFALTVLRIIQLQFGSQIGMNPDYIYLKNEKGNSVYVERTDTSVIISAFKVSKKCLSMDITDVSEIESVVVKLKEKIQCTDNLID